MKRFLIALTVLGVGLVLVVSSAAGAPGGSGWSAERFVHERRR